MTFEEFETIFLEIIKRTSIRETYLNSVPSDIRTAIFDNEYVNQLGITNDILMQCLFGEELLSELLWYLYEWKEGFEISVEDTKYVINNQEDFFKYIKEIYFV